MTANLTVMRSPAEAGYLSHFEAARHWLPGAATVRRKAIERFGALGLPNKRIEAWHYSDLRGQLREAMPLALQPEADAATGLAPYAPADGLATVRFVNGWLQGTPDVPKGVTFHCLANALVGDHPLTERLGKVLDLSSDATAMLNTAFMSDGAIIHVGQGVKVEQPLHLAFEEHMKAAGATHPRVLVVLEAGASLSVVETHRGPDGVPYQTNVVVECDVAEGANLSHIRLNLAGNEAISLSTLAVKVAGKAQVDTFSMTMGAAFSRHQIHTLMEGHDIRFGARGVTLLRGQQHADTTMVSTHDGLRGEGRKLFKTIVDDEARGVFQGKIIVKPQAQKTDGKMSSNALLLGDNAQMHAKPELEIFADDVVCGHGATVGALDTDLLFYLMSRGIPRAVAEGLMIQAFAGEALEAVEHEGMREALIALTAGWIAARA